MEKLIKPKPFEKLTCSDNFMFVFRLGIFL